MILKDNKDNPMYLNPEELFQKQIKLIERVWDSDDDVDETKVEYVDGEVVYYRIDEESHGDLVNAAEKQESKWKES